MYIYMHIDIYTFTTSTAHLHIKCFTYIYSAIEHVCASLQIEPVDNGLAHGDELPTMQGAALLNRRHTIPPQDQIFYRENT